MMATKRPYEPLPDEYIGRYGDAAKRALSHVTQRRKWSDSEWGSPVGVLMLITEIMHLKRQLAPQHSADDAAINPVKPEQ